MQGKLGKCSLLLLLALILLTASFLPKEVQAASGGKGTIKVSTSLNVRAQASSSSAVIGKLYNGNSVTIKEVKNNWGKISYNGRTGYISMQYVSLQSETKVSTTSGVIKVATSLNVRSKPSTSGKVLGSLYNGNKVSITEVSNNWGKISFKGKTGYISMDYVSTSSKAAAAVISPLKGKTIVIDAGHGGKDSGAIGNGLYEKTLVLDIAKKTQAKLEALGAKVVMTRSNDTFLKLETRALIANNAKASLFVSIHMNASTASSAYGTEVYYLPGSSTGAKLAKKVQTNLVKQLGSRDRGTASANFNVLRNTRMPAVLAEIGYITNPTEASKLGSSSYRDKAATGIVKGLESYY